MAIKIRKYQAEDLPEMLAIWNEVVDEGRAFPHKEALDMESASEFFAGQSHCGVAVDEASGKIHGLYILHPNNVGRCGHLSNASYAVSKNLRNRGIGRLPVSLVSESCSSMRWQKAMPPREPSMKNLVLCPWAVFQADFCARTAFMRIFAFTTIRWGRGVQNRNNCFVA